MTIKIEGENMNNNRKTLLKLRKLPLAVSLALPLITTAPALHAEEQDNSAAITTKDTATTPADNSVFELVEVTVAVFISGLFPLILFYTGLIRWLQKRRARQKKLPL
jgi:hypothetical protein